MSTGKENKMKKLHVSLYALMVGGALALGITNPVWAGSDDIMGVANQVGPIRCRTLVSRDTHLMGIRRWIVLT